MEETLGFIGGGNMAQAMMAGIIDSKIFSPENIIVGDLNKDSLKVLEKNYGVNTTTDNNEVVRKAQIVILAVKPHICDIVIDQIKDNVKKDTLIISIAAGKKISQLEERFERDVKLIRVMPNTPALVGKGMSAISSNERVSEGELKEVLEIFESFGEAELIEEKLMDVVTGISGSSPAYVYMFIEALADGGVLEGMPRDKAYKMAAATVLGSAQMVLKTGKHPGELKDMVCSPGGTTIEAVSILENKGLRSAMIEAVRGCVKKSKEL
ncbi:pyrroline-5-carboxylate reductase [Clostridium sp. D2Q-14]|uniref:pyrroline-5-carboxylate reductase n=1 Tax=Anaeromonas gelatinilytica TaxID=2683194 RepID=UPI00193B6E0E|nr:pyrroline-5-carboxylate reductase [Anaeromonas gelatinilytica]MBS4536342.1 pyrroline-5-carboxylate reductase [Anaeromonas gelatinilytica]